MLEHKVERIGRLLKALDLADGKEDFIIRRAEALKYVKAELVRLATDANIADDDLTKEELNMALYSLANGPETITRKNDYEILEILMSTKNSVRKASEAAGGSPS
jgi:flagellar biosynthesis regulator FlaF